MRVESDRMENWKKLRKNPKGYTLASKKIKKMSDVLADVHQSTRCTLMFKQNISPKLHVLEDSSRLELKKESRNVEITRCENFHTG